MSGVRRLGAFALVLATLAACARGEPPAPVVQASGSGPAPAAVGARSAPGEADGEIVVRPGESLYIVAKRSNVPMRTLIEANNLKPPYLLRSGQRLALPRVRTHEVQPGDTLANIARRYGLGTNELVRANGLQPPYAVRAGQVLNLPGTVEPVTTAAAPAAAPPASVPPRGAVESAALPPPSAPSTAGTPAPATPAPASAPATGDLPPLPPPREIGAAPARTAALPADEPDDPPADRGGRGFLWPVRGTIVSDFGSKPGGLQNDGINIAAPRGTPIRAADGGTVVYAGNELKGFGNLLLVRHPDGWITAYAHAEELLVKRGDTVRRGQTIARVGATGGVTSPQLHFEVRRGSRPLNPREVLGPQTAALVP